MIFAQKVKIATGVLNVFVVSIVSIVKNVMTVKTVKYVKDVEIVMKEFKSISYIKLLRDMSEHEIDYYKNNGQKQNKFINKEFNQSLIRCLIINDEYYIGGKINMNELKKILSQLDDILKHNKFTYRIEAIPLLRDLTSETIV